MKKYKLTDADGEEFVVEELPAEEPTTSTTDEGEEVVLTAEEIAWLKAFIAAQKETTDACKDEDEDDTKVKDEDEDEDKDKTSASDSVFGKVKKIVDTKPTSKIASQDDINAAWQAKYDKIRGGNN